MFARPRVREREREKAFCALDRPSDVTQLRAAATTMTSEGLSDERNMSMWCSSTPSPSTSSSSSTFHAGWLMPRNNCMHPNQILRTTKISTDIAHHQDYILSTLVVHRHQQDYIHASTTIISISRTATTIMVAPYQWAAISPCQAPEQLLTDMLTARPMQDHARCDIA